MGPDIADLCWRQRVLEATNASLGQSLTGSFLAAIQSDAEVTRHCLSSLERYFDRQAVKSRNKVRKRLTFYFLGIWGKKIGPRIMEEKKFQSYPISCIVSDKSESDGDWVGIKTRWIQHSTAEITAISNISIFLKNKLQNVTRMPKLRVSFTLFSDFLPCNFFAPAQKSASFVLIKTRRPLRRIQ